MRYLHWSFLTCGLWFADFSSRSPDLYSINLYHLLALLLTYLITESTVHQGLVIQETVCYLYFYIYFLLFFIAKQTYPDTTQLQNFIVVPPGIISFHAVNSKYEQMRTHILGYTTFLPSNYFLVSKWEHNTFLILFL